MHGGGRPDRAVDDAHLAAVHHADDLPHERVILITHVNTAARGRISALTHWEINSPSNLARETA